MIAVLAALMRANVASAQDALDPAPRDRGIYLGAPIVQGPAQGEPRVPTVYPALTEPARFEASASVTREIEPAGYLHRVARPYEELPPPAEELPVPRYERLARLDEQQFKPWTFDMVFIAQSDMDPPSTRVQMIEVGATYQFRYPLGDRFLFTVRPYGDVLFLSGPGGPAPVLPPQLYKTVFDFQFDFRFNERLGISLGLTPGLWTDFVRVTGDDFRLPARLLATYRFSESLHFAGGLIYTDNFYRNLLPAVGVVWNFLDRWRAEVLFPRARLIYLVTDSWQVYAVFERGGDTWNIRTIEPTVIVDENMQYRDYRTMLGTQVTLWKRFDVLVELGFAFYRKFRFEYQPDRNVDPGFLLRAGVHF